MRQGRRWARVRAAAAVATAVMGVSSAARPASAAQGGKNPRRPAEESRVRMILQEAQRSEARIQSGRVELRKLTEISPAGERWLREHIKDPRELQAELEMARQMPRRVEEQETILFDNRRRKMLTRWTRAQGQIALGRVLFTETAFRTYTQSREGPPETRQTAFVDKPKWPPYSPYDCWRGRSWSDRMEGIRAGQITPRWLGEDPKTGQAILLLVGGPHADLDMKIWVDRHRGDTTSRLQAFDKKTGQLDIDETASYRRLRGDLWYPSEVITTYYRCDTRGRRELARRETSVVKNQTLNIAIRESAFAFDPPRGSFVQDSRVQPPLVWTQGVTSPQRVQRGQEPKTEPSLIGRPAPELALPSLSGQRVRLSDWRGKVVLLNLFAYW